MKKSYQNNVIKKILNDGSTVVVDEIPGCSIVFKGNDNEISFYENSRFNSCLIVLLSGSDIFFGESGVFRNMTIYGYGTLIKIGHRFSCWGLEIRAEERGTSLIIGDDCMFSKEINIYPSDCHTIYDIETKECVNKGGVVIIEDHVWCGINVFFSKNSKISADSIVGAGAFVNGIFQEKNALIVGNPARQVRSGVNWDRRAPSEYK